MKLRNKKTGEIIEVDNLYTFANGKHKKYNSLKDFNAEWEDYEEPKNQYYLDCDGRIFEQHTTEYIRNKMKEIGNYFDTREEAEKAVEKLKAAKLLKDMGFKIVGIRYRNNRSYIEWNISPKVRDDHFMAEAFYDALHLLFGGEE